MNQKEDHYAIVVGIDHYQRYDCLQGACNDANDFAEWLEKASGGNLPHGNVKTIVSDKGLTGPTVQLIDEAVIQLLEKSRNYSRRVGTRLYLFMAGHGLSAKTFGPFSGSREVLLAMPKDGNIQAQQYPGIRCADHFRESGVFKEVVLFMDCCRDHLNFNLMPYWVFVPYLNAEARVHHYYAFATGAGQRSREYEINGKWRGIFSQYLIEGLEGKATDGEGNVTGRSLKEYVDRMVAMVSGLSGQAPQQVDTVGDENIILVASKPAQESELVVKRSNPAQQVWLFAGNDINHLVLPKEEKDSFMVFPVSEGNLYLIGYAPTNKPAYAKYLQNPKHLIINDTTRLIDDDFFNSK
ncbi:caspase family protein [Hymenobacter sp. BT186]|uniref:Caspase family protein n=1 Tax=Hymenobacter telluris TaxID=2816474 RepID=A0A939F0X2_9BACT|nr:caspase family protein [Hymenobacter telluris]MBO0360722.1 caspase family protein [Hymenobacter telluris]MBW3376749.1 caspase family protein [Hymenobacter norwichensis]